MKSTLALAVIMTSLFASQVSFARECTSAQWSEATSNYGHLKTNTTLSSDSVAFDLTQLCVEGNVIRPIAGSLFTIDNGMDVEARDVNWSLPVSGEVQVCKDNGGEEPCEWTTVSRTIPTKTKISVVDMGLETTAEVCTKSFQIPACL